MSIFEDMRYNIAYLLTSKKLDIMKKTKGFAGLPDRYKGKQSSKIAVLPVPYDGTSTWIKGADKGPLAIVEASCAVELYDIETGLEAYKQGIYTCPTLKLDAAPEKMVKQVEKAVSGLIEDGKFVVMLGGEHSITTGAVRAHKAAYKDLSVLQLDAHSDLREEYEGSPYNHACVMARVKEICPIVQAGIRSMCVEEKDSYDPRSMFFAEDIVQGYDWMERVINRLSKDVYVTIDLDVFDPSIMPSTGTPEPGGLGWYQVLELLKTLCEKKNVVGFDVVELCPSKAEKAPDFLAAKLIYKFLTYITQSNKDR